MNRRVLVADAYSDAAESLAQILMLNGHQALTADSGTDALALATLFQPEVVFLSLNLPHISGIEVCRSLQTGVHCTPPRMLIALTGDGRDATRAATRAAGFNLHLLKPADPAQILLLLSTLPECSKSLELA